MGGPDYSTQLRREPADIKLVSAVVEVHIALREEPGTRAFSADCVIEERPRVHRPNLQACQHTQHAGLDLPPQRRFRLVAFERSTVGQYRCDQFNAASLQLVMLGFQDGLKMCPVLLP